MHSFKLNLEKGLVLLDSKNIATEENGVLAESVAKLCSPPTQTDDGRTRYYLLGKASIFGKSANVVIEVGEGRIYTVTFLFDLIEFFESSILKSRVLKSCEKSLKLKFKSDHPTTAFLEFPQWGKIVFFYDPKQGDLSLNIVFQDNSISSTSRE